MENLTTVTVMCYGNVYHNEPLSIYHFFNSQAYQWHTSRKQQCVISIIIVDERN